MIETHSQPRAAKSPLQHFQLFPQRPRGLKVKPKKKPKSRLWAPKTDKIREKTETIKNKTDREKPVSQYFCDKMRILIRGFLVPFLRLGPSWDQLGAQKWILDPTSEASAD